MGGDWGREKEGDGEREGLVRSRMCLSLSIAPLTWGKLTPLSSVFAQRTCNLFGYHHCYSRLQTLLGSVRPRAF